VGFGGCIGSDLGEGQGSGIGGGVEDMFAVDDVASVEGVREGEGGWLVWGICLRLRV
jgi:hypothetical protein